MASSVFAAADSARLIVDLTETVQAKDNIKGWSVKTARTAVAAAMSMPPGSSR